MYDILSLFSGIGGLDLGFEGGFLVHKKSIKNNDFIVSNSKIYKDFVLLKKNNFRTIFSNDIEKKCKQIYIKNINIIPNNYVVDSIVNLINNQYNFPKADVILGGFPCKDFSIAGKRLGLKSTKNHFGINDKKEARRGTLYKTMIQIIQKVQPKIFIAENVSGLKSMPNNLLDTIRNDFEQTNNMNYHVILWDIYAPDFGVPQTRKRIFFVGLQKKIYEQNPELYDELLKLDKIFENDDFVSVNNYISYLKEPDESQDESQQNYSKAKFLSKGQGQIEIKLQGLSPTIRAEHHGNIEYRRKTKEHGGIYQEELNNNLIERRLTVRECANIQTFPPNFKLVNKKEKLSTSACYKYIGNAVPPLLGFYIAQNIHKILDYEKSK